MKSLFYPRQVVKLCYVFLIVFLGSFSNHSVAQQSQQISVTYDTLVMCPTDLELFPIRIDTFPNVGQEFVSLMLIGTPPGLSAPSAGLYTAPDPSFILEINTTNTLPGTYHLQLISLGLQSGHRDTIPLVLEVPVPIPAPVAPTLLLPTNNNTNVSLPVRLVWSNSEPGFDYKVMVATDTMFMNIIDSLTTSDTSFVPSMLTTGIPYYWTVTVVDTGRIPGACYLPDTLLRNYFTFTANVNCQSFNTTSQIVPVDCNGMSTGSIALTTNGGHPPYSYSWNNNATTPNLSSLAAGNYDAIISDSVGCADTLTIIITEPVILLVVPNILANYNGHDISCFGACDGWVEAIATGGTPPYNYSWTTGSTTATENNLCAGVYSISVIDANGCEALATVQLNEPLVLTNTIQQVQHPSCATCLDGSVQLAVSGGVFPYTYNWSNNTTSANLTNVGTGTYTVTITDANGCTTVDYVVLSSVTGLTTTNQSHPLKVYPNPSSGTFSIEGNLDSGTAAQIRVSNLLGQQLLEQTIVGSTLNLVVTANTWENGIYIIEIIQEGKRQQALIHIQKE